MLNLMLFVAVVGMQDTPAPEPFYFGVSNAAFQVEGEPEDSDWRRWTAARDPEGRPRIVDGTDASVATSFWRQYDRDFALAQDHGMNAFRMSVAWERIQPDKDEWDDAALDHYVQMVVAMRRRGLEPFITLQHFVLPGWLADEGGLLSPDYPSQFATFSRRVVQRLAAAPAHVRYFITLNEPNIQVRGGYLDSHKFPPGFNDPNKAVQALAALAQAHIEAFAAIRALELPQLSIGVSQNWQVFKPKNLASDASTEGAAIVRHIFNEAFMDAIVTGCLNFNMPGANAVRRRVQLPYGPTLDFVGVQNYGRSYIDVSELPPGFIEQNGDGPTNDLGWEIVPDALEQAVREIAGYGLPVVITETGVADHDDQLRPQYLRDNFAAIEHLRRDGVPLFGYIHWTLTDNFEWAFGQTARFGLAAVDYDTQVVTPRPSLGVYRDLIAGFAK